MSKHKSKRARLAQPKKAQRKPSVKNAFDIATKSSQHRTQHKQHHPVLQPLTRLSDVLLVGEGDFSFARALWNGIPTPNSGSNAHPKGARGTYSTSDTVKVRTLTATSLDSGEEVRRKYPGVETWLDSVQDDHGRTAAATFARSEADAQGHNAEDRISDNDFEDFSTSPSSHSSANPSPSLADHDDELIPAQRHPWTRIHHSIDATRLQAYKLLRRPPVPSPNSKDARKGYTHILFNFPHVGGLSTDRARQIRANQFLLLNFFDSAKALLRRPTPSWQLRREKRKRERKPWDVDDDDDDDDDDDHVSDRNDDSDEGDESKEDGRVVVSLFEGDPYDDWNVRALAKNKGYEVERSGAFSWELWGKAGYRHARTLGVLKSRGQRRDGDAGVPGAVEEAELDKGEEDEARAQQGDKEKDKRRKKDGWRGEERAARMYIFKLKEQIAADGTGANDVPVREKKRRKGDDSGSE